MGNALLAKRRVATRLFALRISRLLNPQACGQSVVMKSRFEEWAVARAQLTFCAPTLREPRVKRAVPASSDLAHPYAPRVAPRKPARVVAVQHPALFGRAEREPRVVAVPRGGREVAGLAERLGIA